MALREWWHDHAQKDGAFAASSLLLQEFWGYARDSTPARRRARYGDMDYDWECGVNTTSGTLGWRERLLGIFHSAYQPTDPTLFREMMAVLPIDYREFVFVDLGSGKGRTLLMASEYNFRKIIGVELIPELHHAAQANIVAYQHGEPHPVPIDSLCMDARDFLFPEEPLVLYLFNPLPEVGLKRVLTHLEVSWTNARRPLWIVYHNPEMETLLAQSNLLIQEITTPQFSIFRTR
jgi:SAM-dependent methyltransferase